MYSHINWAASLLVAFEEISSFTCNDDLPHKQSQRWQPPNPYNALRIRERAFCGA